LLVSSVDDTDAILMTAVEDREDMPAGQREEMLDTQRLERSGCGKPAMSLLAHGGELTRAAAIRRRTSSA
jgi:hypothetical protein